MRTSPASSYEVCAKVKSRNPHFLLQATKYVVRERAVRSLLSRVDPLSEETMRARVGAIAAQQESDKLSETLALG